MWRDQIKHYVKETKKNTKILDSSLEKRLIFKALGVLPRINLNVDVCTGVLFAPVH